MNRSLAIKYFGGKATPEEAALMEEWLQSPENQRRMEQWLWEDWQTTGGAMPRETVRRMQNNLHRNIRQPRVIPWKKALSAAAAVLIIVVTGALLRSRKPTASVTAQIVFADSLVNSTGTPVKATLPDSSIVWLNANTVVAIADGFGRRDRRVRVSGEAYFDIKTDPARPFLAGSGPLTTSVLGTTFTIEAYPAEKEIRVSLISGKVAVGSTNTSCTLIPGQMATYASQGRTVSISSLTLDPAAWIHGKIILNRLALPEALDRLSRCYHIPIRYDPEQLQKMVITGEFDRDSLSEVLRSVLFVHNLRFRDMGNDGYRIF
ncbi:MAG TPA: FecR domain-containing protein [Puia sp.]|nr:FecR domain-containing protein [Puia sp.]